MVDTARTNAAVKALLADNSNQAISPQDLRDTVESIGNPVIGGGLDPGYANVMWPQFAGGAKGDGSDDSAAITAAIAASPHVVFPAGYTFTHASTLVPAVGSMWTMGGMRRYDASTGGTALKYTGSSKAIDCTGVNNFEIRDGKVEVTNTAAVALYLGSGCNYIDLTRVTLTGPGASGTSFGVKGEGQTTCQCHNTFRGVEVSGFATGVSLSGYSNANQFINCVLINCTTALSIAKTGSDTTAGDDNLIERLEIPGATNGIVLADGADKNMFLKVVEDGTFTSSLSIASNCADNVFIGTTLHASGTVTDASSTTSYIKTQNAPTPAAFTISNRTAQHTFDCDHAFDATGFAILSDVVAQIIVDLDVQGLLNT